MGIALAVFSLIFAVSVIVIRSTSTKYVSVELDSISSSYASNSTIYRQDALIIQIRSVGEPEILFSGGDYSTELYFELVNLAKNIDSGSIGNVFFKTTPSNQGTLLVALDMSEYLDFVKFLYSRILLVLVAFYVIFSLIICACSVKVFRPLQESVHRQKQFISDAGHELKTPITIISASCDVLAKTEKSKYLQNIIDQTKRLEFLVNDMLTLAKIDEEKFAQAKERISLSQEIEKCSLPFEEAAFESGKLYIVDINENIEITTDAKSVTTVVNVLLDNAFKYADKNGTIKLSLKTENNKPTLTVFNTGSEILNENSNKIFERFYRGEDSRARELGGNGLGLAIAKNVCNLCGWKISANSKYKESMEIKVVF